MRFFSYPSKGEMSEKVMHRISTVISQGQFIGGVEVAMFEKSFATYTGASDTVTCGNGLDALSLALQNIQLPNGSRVAVSGHTFFATWLAILNAGHVPVGVDADLVNLQMNPQQLRETLRLKNIQAVVYVHMHGILGEIEEIAGICTEFSVPLIEDCAQAHGLRSASKHVGTFGEYGAFSFYPTKNLPALGDGGAVISDKHGLEIVRSRANYGWLANNRDKHEILGVNSRLDSIQAAILNVHLEYLESLNACRKWIAEQYLEVISGSKLINSIDSEAKSVWHHFPIRVENRLNFIEFMKRRDIPVQIHYLIPCHLQPAFLESQKEMEDTDNLKNVEEISRTIVSLPLHPWLTEEEIRLVVDSLRDWTSQRD